MVVVLAPACGPDTIVADSGSESSSGATAESTTPTSETAPGTESSGESETQSITETDTETEAETETETETGGEAGPPLPEYEGDTCEVEVLWSHRASGGGELDDLSILESDGPGRFIVAGGARADTNDDSNVDESATIVLAVEAGETSWTHVGPWSEDSSSIHIQSLTLAPNGDIYTVVNGFPYGFFDPQRFDGLSPAGELLFTTETEDADWNAMAWLDDELLVLGRYAPGIDWDVNDTFIPLSFARFDAELELLGVAQAGYDEQMWTLLDPRMLVDAGRIWIGSSNYSDALGVLAEFDAAGQQVWLSYVEDRDASTWGLARLSGGNLVSAGTLEVTEPEAISGPGVTGWSADGTPEFAWLPESEDSNLGIMSDVEALAEGGFVTLGSDRAEGPDSSLVPTLWRFDEQGQLLSTCHLSRLDLDDPSELKANAHAIEVDDEGRIFALIDDWTPDYPGESTILEVSF